MPAATTVTASTPSTAATICPKFAGRKPDTHASRIGSSSTTAAVVEELVVGAWLVVGALVGGAWLVGGAEVGTLEVDGTAAVVDTVVAVMGGSGRVSSRGGGSAAAEHAAASITRTRNSLRTIEGYLPAFRVRPGRAPRRMRSHRTPAPA